MKFAVIAFAALASSHAFAGALDVVDPYAGRPFIANPDSSCRNGQSQMFVESINGVDRYVNVIRTCVDGVYYPRRITKNKPCKDGAVGFWSVSNGVNRNGTDRFVCVKGRYIQQ